MTFDESNLVPNAGLLPAAVLARRLDLGGLIDGWLRLAEPWRLQWLFAVDRGVSLIA